MDVYVVRIKGIEHTVKLSAATAKHLGLTPVNENKTVPASKAKTPANKRRAGRVKANEPTSDSES